MVSRQFTKVKEESKVRNLNICKGLSGTFFLRISPSQASLRINFSFSFDSRTSLITVQHIFSLPITNTKYLLHKNRFTKSIYFKNHFIVKSKTVLKYLTNYVYFKLLTTITYCAISSTFSFSNFLTQNIFKHFVLVKNHFSQLVKLLKFYFSGSHSGVEFRSSTLRNIRET